MLGEYNFSLCSYFLGLKMNVEFDQNEIKLIVGVLMNTRFSLVEASLGIPLVKKLQGCINDEGKET